MPPPALTESKIENSVPKLADPYKIKTQIDSIRPITKSEDLDLLNKKNTSGNNMAHQLVENSSPPFSIPSSKFLASSESSSKFSLPSNHTLPNIQLPTQPLDISEVTEFSSRNKVSSQPPANVTSTFENIATSKPSTVSLLRGMRLKKNLQSSGSKLDVKDDLSDEHNSKADDEKKRFVRPFEDGYTSNLNFETIPDVLDNSYTPPEYKVTENSIPGDINVSIPVSLESNLKHINSKTVVDGETTRLYQEISNNNNSGFPSQVCKIQSLLILLQNLIVIICQLVF